MPSFFVINSLLGFAALCQIQSKKRQAAFAGVNEQSLPHEMFWG